MAINKKAVSVEKPIKPSGVLLPVIVIFVIIAIVANYMYIQRKSVVDSTEQVTSQMAEYIASNIANEVGYAKSSIRLSAVTLAQTMTGEELEKPAEVILPMVENTPFGSIEYIRADGMNVMNIGEPFDASDRVYYIEGMKGNTGVWNNYHPRTSQETLINFYTPLIYEGKPSGVITGYIAATTQIVPLFETKLYDQDIYGVLLDENNMVICSTVESEYVKDMTLDMFMDLLKLTEAQKQNVSKAIELADDTARTYKNPNGDERICIKTIPGTQWKAVILVPAASFRNIVNNDTKHVLITIVLICIVLISYAAYVLLRNMQRRKEIAIKNKELEEENRLFDEENRRVFSEITEIRDIIASANMGTWRIELMDKKEPRMFVDKTMRSLLGIADSTCTPEQTYKEWFSNITPAALQSVLDSVEKMKQGSFDENTYLWMHPTKGQRYVRCGGTSQKLPDGYVLSGYHYDVDDVVREDQAKVVMLKNALNEKNEYYSTLGNLASIFYSMHVINLVDDTVTEINAQNEVKQIVNHKEGAVLMMQQVMSAVAAENYKEESLEFTDLTTLPERMKNKKIISRQLIGKSTGWYLASFITVDADNEGRPEKVIYTTRVIDEEKKQQEKLIKKSQTDELTGLFNRRAYEEDIYEHNDTPSEDDFVYISLDVNGLKVVNDTYGHMAGDELIIGACQCMKKSLGPYGRLYRTGGDEFVAIIFCNEQKLKEITADFDDTIANWSGKLVDSLTISYGCACKKEMPEYSVRQLGALAEQRMYDAKEMHYKKTGVDRRGQQDAHKALCNLYTKILKINITDDTYRIVNMDNSEQTEEKGFSDKISEWLTMFGKSGQVHADDLEDYLHYTNLEYMRSYFETGKTSLHVFYRRKYMYTFKQTMMEIIPANDYSEDNQSLFLYVKDIEK